MRMMHHDCPSLARKWSGRPLARLCPLRRYPAPCCAFLFVFLSAPNPRQAIGPHPLGSSLVTETTASFSIVTRCFYLTKRMFAQVWSVVVSTPMTSAMPCVARLSRLLSAIGKNLYARVRAYICACACARENTIFASISVYSLTIQKALKKLFSFTWLCDGKHADHAMTIADQTAGGCHV